MIAGFSFGGAVAYEAARYLAGTAFSWDELRAAISRAATALPPRAAHQVECYLIGLFRRHAHHAWQPEAIDIPVWLAGSDENAPLALSIWNRLCERRVVVRLPGEHLGIFDPPAAQSLSTAFITAVNAARERSLHEQEIR